MTSQSRVSKPLRTKPTSHVYVAVIPSDATVTLPFTGSVNEGQSTHESVWRNRS